MHGDNKVRHLLLRKSHHPRFEQSHSHPQWTNATGHYFTNVSIWVTSRTWWRSLIEKFGWRTRSSTVRRSHACFFIVRAQLSNWTSTVPRHMLQYGRNKQQHLRVIHIHEQIYANLDDTDDEFFFLYRNNSILGWDCTM